MVRLNKNLLIKSFVRLFGMEAYKPSKYPKDFDAETIKIIDAVSPYTMIERDRLHALITGIKYIVQNNIGSEDISTLIVNRSHHNMFDCDNEKELLHSEIFKFIRQNS